MTETEFVSLADPYRPDLLRLCYRMLGSVHDAEDAVQESYLRAWRSYADFDGRASLRTWLYRIATNVCLRSLETAGRRPLPSGLAAASPDPVAPLNRAPEIPWLEPFPTDPALIVDERATLRLALIAALQWLPARQRAVLIFREVLRWHAAEVAKVLDTSVASVNSLLQRARAHLATRTDLDAPSALDANQRAFVDRYMEAFANADVDALVSTLTEDATCEMPPNAEWFAGRAHIARFLKTRLPYEARVFPTEANGQPAMASYFKDTDGLFRPHSIHVFTATPTGISRVVAFIEPNLFSLFGFPETMDSG